MVEDHFTRSTLLHSCNIFSKTIEVQHVKVHQISQIHGLKYIYLPSKIVDFLSLGNFRKIKKTLVRTKFSKLEKVVSIYNFSNYEYNLLIKHE